MEKTLEESIFFTVNCSFSVQNCIFCLMSRAKHSEKQTANWEKKICALKTNSTTRKKPTISWTFSPSKCTGERSRKGKTSPHERTKECESSSKEVYTTQLRCYETASLRSVDPVMTNRLYFGRIFLLFWLPNWTVVRPDLHCEAMCRY